MATVAELADMTAAKRDAASGTTVTKDSASTAKRSTVRKKITHRQYPATIKGQTPRGT